MDIEGLDIHVFEDTEDKENEVEVAVEADQRDTPMHAGETNM